MSAIVRRSTAWMASSVPKPTFLTASTALLDASALTPCALARDAIDRLILSVCAACSAAPRVHAFAQSRAFLIDSAIKLPAAAPFCRLLHAGQTGIYALDRGVRFVNIHLDDEFELLCRPWGVCSRIRLWRPHGNHRPRRTEPSPRKRFPSLGVSSANCGIGTKPPAANF